MTPASESLVKKLVLLTTLAVLGSSIAFLLVACGAEHSQPRPRAGSALAAWRSLPAAPITVDAGLTSVWSGKELIVSGVKAGKDGTFIGSTEVAAAYNPATRTWRRLARSPETQNYCRRDAVWTGTEMLVWGCGQVAFDPATDHWRRLPRAPGGQGIVIWTGKEMIGWGGGCCGDAWSGGAAYDPATNSWRTLARSPLAPAQGPIGAWTGRELVLCVSGLSPDGKPVKGARAAAYDPAKDTWRRLAPLPGSGVPLRGTAVWNGHEVLVVGAGKHAQAALAYNPAANRWRRLAPLPSGRLDATAVWTGTRLLVWGSRTGLSAAPAAGLAYNPKADRWSQLPRGPLQGFGQTVAWTGRQLLVWGGGIQTSDGRATQYLATGAAFTPALERSRR